MQPLTPVLAIMGLGTQEMVLILLILLLLFGASKIPGIARSLGKSVNEFKSGMKAGAEAPKPDAPAKDAGPSKN